MTIHELRHHARQNMSPLAFAIHYNPGTVAAIASVVTVACVLILAGILP